MKNFTFLVAILAILFVSCSNNEDQVTPPTGEAKLTIKLIGNNPISSRATGTPTQAQENSVKNFTVYIYANNVLEKSEAFTPSTAGDLTKTVSGLTTGVKTIVVLANLPAGFPTFATGDSYAELASTSNYVALDSQQSLNNGLFMSGEVANQTLVASPTDNTVNIPISRIVAKIMLKSVTIDAAAGYDPAKFELTGVAIIKAKSKSSVGVPSIVTATPLFGGVESSSVTSTNIKSYLYEPLTVAGATNIYFYVFANDDTNDDATLISLIGVYDNKPAYFPIVIENTLTGKFIERNTQHTIDVTLKILAGNPDIETPKGEAYLEVTISPTNWVVEPIQSVEW